MITRYSLREQVQAGRRLNILLAEDNLVNQKLATRLLEKRNHLVTVVANGKEALAALEQGRFDLVLMDVQMAEMDGLEATAILRKQEKGTGRHQPVVAMTALAMNGDKERCIAAGMDGYLSKPIRPQELDEVLDSYVSLCEAPAVAAKDVSAFGNSIQVEQLLDRLDDDRMLLAELVDVFRAEYPGNLRAAQEAIDTQNAHGLRSTGHTLKGALANLSAMDASALAAELEAIGKSANFALAQATLDQLTDDLGDVLRALDGLCLAVAR